MCVRVCLSEHMKCMCSLCRWECVSICECTDVYRVVSVHELRSPAAVRVAHHHEEEEGLEATSCDQKGPEVPGAGAELEGGPAVSPLPAYLKQRFSEPACLLGSQP